jgi:hypothetical protein
MAKPKLTGTFSTDSKLFDDLEKYLNFCREYGYKYDESELYDMRSYAYRQYSKLLSNKHPKDQWMEDAKAFAHQ